MAENGMERSLGRIEAMLEASDQKHRDFRNDIKELYGKTDKNKNDVGAAHIRLDSMKEDVDAMKKKSAWLGGGSGVGGSAIMIALKEFFMGGN